MKKRWFMIAAIIGIVLIGVVAVGPIMSDVETPSYEVITAENNIEVRQYIPMIVAEVQMNGRREDAIGDGFCYESALTLEQVREVVKQQSGQNGLDQLPERLERAHKNGHSAMDGGTLEDFLCCNRAGENEAHLSFDECVRRFLS